MKKARASSLLTDTMVQAKLEKYRQQVQDVVEDFVSQFEIAYRKPGAEASDEANISAQVRFAPGFLDEIKAEAKSEKMSVAELFEKYDIKLLLDIEVTGAGAKKCAKLMVPALNLSDIEIPKKTDESGPNPVVSCLANTEDFDKKLDRLHEFARGVFENYPLLQQMYEAERKIQAINRKSPSGQARSLDIKLGDKDGKNVLVCTYPTSDKKIVKQLKGGEEECIGAMDLLPPGHYTNEVYGVFEHPRQQEEACTKLMDAIVASVERGAAANALETRRGIEQRGSYAGAADTARASKVRHK